MKYLTEPKLTALSNFLSECPVGDRVIKGRIEAFSCKRGGGEKQLAKSVDSHIEGLLATSPADVASPFGPITDSNVRRIITDLIFTLNASFPDYDFSLVRPDQFQKETVVPLIMNKVNAYLAEVAEAHKQNLLNEVWSSIDEAIQIHECEIYSYIPDLEGDPFSEGSLWSFNYFFCNKAMKRIVYFTCMAESIEISHSDSDMEMGVETPEEDFLDWDEDSSL